MTRRFILNQIKYQCIERYQRIDNWIHDINHIKAVVKNGKKLSRMEGLKSKTAFLVELACWLHDLGRIKEKTGLLFLESNHAEKSYMISKKLIKPYQRYLGQESVYQLLQAVREHNLPELKHPGNVIGRILLDADRGAGLNLVGVFTTLNYMGVITTNPVRTKKQAQQQFNALKQGLRQQGKVAKALEYLSYLIDWYYGNSKQIGSGIRVTALYTDSARKIYLNGLRDIQDLVNQLENLK